MHTTLRVSPRLPHRCRAKFQEEIKQLEQAKNDLQLEHTFLLDKFRQLKAENDRLRGEIDGMKGRLTHAADDYVRCMGRGVGVRVKAPGGMVVVVVLAGVRVAGWSRGVVWRG